MRRPSVLVTVGLIVAILLPVVPSTIVAAQEIAIPLVETPLPEPPFIPPQEPEEPPVVEVILPSLSMTVVTPDVVRVGDTLTATIVLANLSADPAEDLVVTVPVPEGVVIDPRLLDPNARPDRDGRTWSWNLGTMKGQSRIDVVLPLQVVRMPPGEAVVLTPTALARGLSEPAWAQGGALIDERSPDEAPVTASQDPVDAASQPDVTPAATDLSSTATSLIDQSQEAPIDSTTTATPPAPQTIETPFIPANPTTLRSYRGRVEVAVPGNAFGSRLRLTYRTAQEAEPTLRAAGERIPPKLVNGRRSFGIFHLDAFDDSGKAIHQFDAPLTIVARYTDEQLRALETNPGQLSIFWFDPDLEVTYEDGTTQTGQWLPIPSTVDADAKTVTATVDHFSAFTLGDGLSPSSKFLPSLQGWQVGTFTGGAQFSYPMDVPAGPGGLKPNLVLSYASNADDGSSGARNYHQAGWVGRGWSFQPGGAIARNKNGCCENWDHFTLTAMGHSFDVTRGNPIVSPYQESDLSDWEWHIVDEAYWKIRYEAAAGAWRAWSPDGTKYNFTQPLRWGWTDPERYETYQWLLTSVVDPNGNKITFTYDTDPIVLPGGTINPTHRIEQIAWGYDGATPGTGNPRYRVTFASNDRWTTSPTQGVDTKWDFSANQVYTNAYTQPPVYPGAGMGAPHEVYRLDDVIFSIATSPNVWQNVTQWKLDYATAANSVRSDGENGQKMLTLLSVKQGGWNSSAWSYLPSTTFTYQLARGTTSPTPPTAGWNRLLTVNNGQGGKVTFSYGHIWAASGGVATIPAGEGYYEGSPYAYRFRVRQVLQEDTAGQSYSTASLITYTPSVPALNTESYAATVRYAHYPPPHGGDSRAYLARPEKSEFRGFETVITRVYDGSTTSAALLQQQQEWFYQGRQVPSACTPALISGIYVDVNSSCFQNMVKSEAWKGRAYKSELQTSGGTALQRSETSYVYQELPFYNSTLAGGYRRAGLWRAFTGESQVKHTTIIGAASNSTTTKSFYVGGCASGAPTAYGQVLCTQEFDQQNTLIRKTEHAYIARNTLALNTFGNYVGDYIVDRPFVTTISNGSSVFQAHRQYFYDSYNTTLGSMGSHGRLTRSIQVSNIGGLANVGDVDLYGVDTTYTHTDQGHVATETSYDGAGWVKFNTTLNQWTSSTPGNGSTARTTITTYDTTYRHVPRSVVYPLSVGGAALTESADYDWRFPALNRVTDFNNQTTTATYDHYGRLLTIRKPGDESGVATVAATYKDTEIPFRYEVRQREEGSTIRLTQLLYNGLGQQVQTKVESSSGTVWKTSSPIPAMMV
ncbi:MAG: hypothetical protein HC822_10395 [Oscillochloris sp.]|nr:hypothetical protein [Oscillochloris sp.]